MQWNEPESSQRTVQTVHSNEQSFFCLLIQVTVFMHRVTLISVEMPASKFTVKVSKLPRPVFNFDPFIKDIFLFEV